MNTSCRQCQASFSVTSEDRRFLEMLSPVIGGKTFALPEPTLCPDCRQQRRVAQANQLNLYERTCDLTGASIITNFPASSPYKVYRCEDWYSDKWDPLAYGRAFDFSRPFFEQFQELSLAVPRPALHKAFEFDENADYTNYAGRNKNCYLIFDSEDNRDCYYNYSINSTESCMECFRIRTGELLYGCIDCTKCYGCAFCQDCENCSESIFLKNCIGCMHCLMCSNLRNKEYFVENKPVAKEEFERLRSMLTSYSKLQAAAKRFAKLKVEYPQKFMHGVQNEDVIGDYLTNAKHAAFCFDSPDLWDCRYVFQAFGGMKNSMDIQECGEAEQVYESAFSGYQTRNLFFSVHNLGGQSDMFYCMHSPHSRDLFGCVGTRHKEYCILNKQYTKEEYEALVLKIIDHMRNDGAATNPSRSTALTAGSASGSWGEFFPIELSLFSYNETLAQDYFPLTKEEVQRRGWKWLDDAETRDQYMGPNMEIPDDIDDVPDDITKKILTCEASGKQYKIIPQELALYRQMQLPLPHKRFFERHKDRMKLRNPRKLYDRTCNRCSVPFRTTYAPDRPEKIYCEPCYQESLA